MNRRYNTSAKAKDIRSTSSARGAQATGVIMRALAFSNPHDSHTLNDALEQYKRLKDKVRQNVYTDRGYKGMEGNFFIYDL